MKLPSQWPATLTQRNFTATIYRRDYEKKGKPYTEFKFAYYDANGARQFKSSATWEGIQKAAEDVADALRVGNASALTLTAEDKTIYCRALEFLKPTGVPLDIAAREFAEIYLKRHAIGSDKTVQQVVDEFLDRLEKRDRKPSEKYLADLNSRLSAFAEALHIPISKVTPEHVDEFLSQFKGRTRFNYARIIRTLFNYAQAKKYIPRDVDPFEGVDTDYHDDGEVEIFTPEEMEKLLAAARQELIPFLTIGAFAGLRSAEIARLDWSDIRGEHIHVTAGKAKTRSRRLVPIQPNLAQWLAPHRRESGVVVPFANISKQLMWLADESGVKWKHNALRHSFISYRLAAMHDENRVANEAGNSPQMIHRNYRELVTEAQGKAWFSIGPETPANVIPVAAGL
jgi:integrase